MKTTTVAIIGTGTMGCATALDIAKNGHHVILKDIDADVLAKAETTIRNEYRRTAMFNQAYLKVDLNTILGRITIQNNYDNVHDASIIIENITENIELKKAEYEKLRHVSDSETIFALNTSCISITKLAQFLPYPENVIGTHFMNPVPMKKMVEVIRGYHTSSETESNMISFLESIQKEAVVIDDFPGFVSNRISHLLMNEAAYIVQDGIAEPHQVDKIMRDGFNQKMGPLETADLIGLDTVKDSLEILYQSYQDPKYRCSPLLSKMVDANQLGRKSGKGFYDYT